MAPLKELLDLTYELEALVTLALMREGVPSRLNELIAAKAAAIGAACGENNAQVAEASSDDTGSYSYSIEEPEAVESSEKNNNEPMPVEEVINSAQEEIIGEVGVESERTEIVSPPENKAGDALRKRFSLNDKFRFRRELFAGNDLDFSEAIDTIASFDNLSDAEDYLYSQLRMDPDDEAVKAFVEIISGYFS